MVGILRSEITMLHLSQFALKSSRAKSGSVKPLVGFLECDHILEDEEYLYKGKSYCDDCHRAVKKAVTGNST
ncbi:MAG TPA: hypothetical protein VE378_03520 [Nitrososphaeraceae archaeon]|jgi:hypothetical protein|nr:hypothetical protein [Nitrososphaeraceae archaeon]